MQTVKATVVQAESRSVLDVSPDALITIDADGRIVSVEPADGRTADVELPDSAVLIPGLVDTHIHAPQWPQLGRALDLPLEEWLIEHTFPLEARYADTEFARTVWDHMIPTLLSYGTTTAVYYATVHVPAATALAESCIDHGQRALVGRVAMDHPDQTPEFYRDPDSVTAVERSRASVAEIRALGSPLVEPIITPRFIPTSTDEMLFGLADLAQEAGVRVQTHCSESDWEHDHVLERCGATDTEALDRFGLLRRSTVLAHGNRIGDEDLARIVGRGAGVAHCPLSNVYFSNSVFPARRAMDMGVHVGLGTDVSGGPSPSLLHQCAQAVGSSRLLEEGVDGTVARPGRGVAQSRLTSIEAFWAATRGGADLLDLPVGGIEAGRWFDAVAIDPQRAVPRSLHRWPGETVEQYFEKVVRLTEQDDISHVWVAGRLVAGRRGRPQQTA